MYKRQTQDISEDDKKLLESLLSLKIRQRRTSLLRTTISRNVRNTLQKGIKRNIPIAFELDRQISVAFLAFAVTFILIHALPLEQVIIFEREEIVLFLSILSQVVASILGILIAVYLLSVQFINQKREENARTFKNVVHDIANIYWSKSSSFGTVDQAAKEIINEFTSFPLHEFHVVTADLQSITEMISEEDKKIESTVNSSERHIKSQLLSAINRAEQALADFDSIELELEVTKYMLGTTVKLFGLLILLLGLTLIAQVIPVFGEVFGGPLMIFLSILVLFAFQELVLHIIHVMEGPGYLESGNLMDYIR